MSKRRRIRVNHRPADSADDRGEKRGKAVVGVLAFMTALIGLIKALVS